MLCFRFVEMTGSAVEKDPDRELLMGTFFVLRYLLHVINWEKRDCFSQPKRYFISVEFGPLMVGIWEGMTDMLVMFYIRLTSA